MKRAVFHPEAQDEFDDAADYYDGRQPGLGDDFRDEIAIALDRIGRQPKAAPRYPGTPCRKTLVARFPYKLVYLEQPAELFVVAVHHGSRRPGYWLHRLPP